MENRIWGMMRRIFCALRVYRFRRKSVRCVRWMGVFGRMTRGLKFGIGWGWAWAGYEEGDDNLGRMWGMRLYLRIHGNCWMRGVEVAASHVVAFQDVSLASIAVDQKLLWTSLKRDEILDEWWIERIALGQQNSRTRSLPCSLQKQMSCMVKLELVMPAELSRPCTVQ